MIERLPSGPSFDLVHLPGGAFRMGSLEEDEEAYDREKPVHEVRLASFYLGKFPVTQALWAAVMGENPSGFQGDDRPVERVSWYDAAVFCNRLSEGTGRRPSYYADLGLKQVYGKTARAAWELLNAGEVFFDASAGGYRLPTEAEWEYAARGGAQSEGYLYAGSDKLKEVGWYDENSGGETRAVGQLYPNELGFYDLSGNVHEWCWDWFDEYYYQACQKMGVAENPLGPDKGVCRVVRGGDWGDGARGCRAAYRGRFDPVHRDYYVGFRVALSLQSVG